MRGTVASIASRLIYDFGLLVVWKRVPKRLRQWFVSKVVRLPQRGGTVPSGIQGPVHILGMASSHSSLGWVTRSAIRQVEAMGESPIVWNVAARFGSDHGERSGQEGSDPDSREPYGPGTLVICVNPNQIGYALSGAPPRIVENKRLVGYFVWELEEIPANWLEAVAYIDEIWAPTQFVFDAFRRATNKPIRLMPYRLTIPDDLTPDRAYFRLPENYLVLVAANLQSGTERKNLQASVDAFRLAFGDDPSATLVLKLHDVTRMPERKQKLMAGLANVNVVVVEDDLTDHYMWKLIRSCDCILSMHRSEGYGLLLKQALMLNIPVVATGWSGNVDFMKNDPNAYCVRHKLIPVVDQEGIYAPTETARWADPDRNDAARLLLSVRSNARVVSLAPERRGRLPK